MKKKVVAIVSIIVIVIVVLFIGKRVSINNKYFKGKRVRSIVLSEVSNEESVDKELNKILNSHKYSLDKPYVKLNPYGISPLSAIIIFRTNKSTSFKLYINGEYSTTMSSSKIHSIPIYGLRENYNNKIGLVSGSKSKSITIKTPKSDVTYPLKVEENHNTDNKKIYFTVSSYKDSSIAKNNIRLTGYDTKGNLRYYLTEDNRMDVEWLDNGHFLIGTAEGDVNDSDQFVSFVEMDYLGKIYNYYNNKYGYSFEFQKLGNYTIMASGGDTPIVFKRQMLYIMDLETGSIISKLDIYDAIKKVDKDFNDEYLGNKAVRNGFYYNEETGDVIVSFRGMNALIDFDYNKKTVKWVLTDPNNELFKNDCWDKYLIKTDSGRYPLGQHSPQFIDKDTIIYYNNGYDRYESAKEGFDDTVSRFDDNYSSVEVFRIDSSKRIATTIEDYDFGKKLLSIKYGYARRFDNGHTLIDNGYVLKDEYRKSNNTVKNAEATVGNNYAEVIEYDSDDNILFKARSEEGKFRAFINYFYKDKTDNISFTPVKIHDNISKTRVDRCHIDLDKATPWIYTYNMTNNTIETNYKIKENDSINIIFMNKSGNGYKMIYKNHNNTKTLNIFNVELKSGDYNVFIELNGVLYNTNKVYRFR